MEKIEKYDKENEKLVNVVDQVRRTFGAKRLRIGLDKCAGFLVAHIVKGSAIIGTGGGKAAIIVRKKKGWAPPIFFHLGGVGGGLSIGLETTYVIKTFTTMDRITNVMSGEPIFGTNSQTTVFSANELKVQEVSQEGYDMDNREQALSPEEETTLREKTQDFMFLVKKGFYAGFGMSATALHFRKNMNASIYGKCSPKDIYEDEVRGWHESFYPLKRILEGLQVPLGESRNFTGAANAHLPTPGVEEKTIARKRLKTENQGQEIEKESWVQAATQKAHFFNVPLLRYFLFMLLLVTLWRLFVYLMFA
jgi:lipid-binding SYLF domain-containing protein